MTTFEKKAQATFSHFAGEQVSVEEIKGTIYAYCSEIAALRLYKTYANNGTFDRVEAKYSPNLKTWFFRMEPATA